MEERFTVDRNLGKLAKWLRILGYDTRYERGDADPGFVCRAVAEGRTVLTRKREMAGAVQEGKVVLILGDRVTDQITEVLGALSLKPDPAKRLTRCLNCNTLLVEIEKGGVEGLVPHYVWQRYKRFRRCTDCGRIFWPGTHRLHIEETLRRRSPAGHP